MHEPAKASELRRVMGFVDLLLFLVITNFSVIWVVEAAKAGAAGVSLWVASGLMFYLPLAVSVLTLTARCPGEGGLYIWTREAFGEFAGFLTGWAYWACILPFLPIVLYFVAGSALYLGGGRWDHLSDNATYFIVMSLVCLAIASWLNIVGLDVGKWLHNAGAIGTWMPALALMVLACVAWARQGSATGLAVGNFVPKGSLQEGMLFSVLVLGLTGLEAVPVFGDEIHNVHNHVPRAVSLAAVFVIITNIVGTLAVLVALPSNAIAGSQGFMQAYSMAADRAGVGGFVPFIAGLVVVGYVGKVGAWSATGARLPFVAGETHPLLERFSRLHPRWRTPHLALLLQAAIVAVLIVLGQMGTTTKGAFEVFQSMTLIPTFIPFIFLFGAAYKAQLGRSDGAWRRGTIQALAAIGLMTTLVAMVLAIVPPDDEPNKVLYVGKVVGLAFVLVGGGIIIYFTGKRHHPMGGGIH